MARPARGAGSVVLAIAMVLAIGTGLYAASGASRVARASNDPSFARARAHDLRVALTEARWRGRRLRRWPSDPGRRLVARRRSAWCPPRSMPRGGAHRAGAGPDRRSACHRHRRWTACGPGPAEPSGPGRRARPTTPCSNAAFARHLRTAPRGHRADPAPGERPLRGSGPRPPSTSSSVGGPAFGGEAASRWCSPSLTTAQRAAGRARRSTSSSSPSGVDVEAGERRVRAALRRRLPGLGATVTRAHEGAGPPRPLPRRPEGDQRILNVFAFLCWAGRRSRPSTWSAGSWRPRAGRSASGWRWACRPGRLPSGRC